MQANERTDEQVPQYFSLYFLLFWPTVSLSFTDSFFPFFSLSFVHFSSNLLAFPLFHLTFSYYGVLCVFSASIHYGSDESWLSDRATHVSEQANKQMSAVERSTRAKQAVGSKQISEW